MKSIEWLHNGRPISASSSLRVRLLSREVLHIGKVSRADSGMYQCLAFNDLDSAQAQLQLQVGDEQGALMQSQAWPRSGSRPERDSG